MKLSHLLLSALAFVFILFVIWLWGADVFQRGPELGFAVVVATCAALPLGVWLKDQESKK